MSKKKTECKFCGVGTNFETLLGNPMRMVFVCAKCYGESQEPLSYPFPIPTSTSSQCPNCGSYYYGTHVCMFWNPNKIRYT